MWKNGVYITLEGEIMSWIKIGFAISTIAMMFGCEAGESIVVFDNKTPTPQRTVQLDTMSMDSDLQKLLENSDLVVAGKLKETSTLINPTEMEKEMNRSGTNLPNLRSYVEGLVHEIEITTTVLNKTDSTELQTVFIYTLGDPYSLHSTVIRPQNNEEYLFFLSLPKNDEVEHLRILKPDEVETVALSENALFSLTEGKAGAKQISENSDLLERVRSLAKSTVD